MKALTFLSLLWLVSDPTATVSVLRARYAYAQTTRPLLPDSLTENGPATGTLATIPDAVSLELNQAALSAAMAHPQRELIVYSQPFPQCPPCRTLFNAVGEGDADLHLEWVKSNFPAWVTATPTIYDPVRNQYLVGIQTLPQLRRWTGLGPASTVGSPSRIVGTIHNAAAFNAAIQKLRELFGKNNSLRLEHGGTMSFGHLEVVLASPITLRWDFTGPTQHIKFEGAKPVLRAWGVQVPCDGVTYDGQTLTLQIPRFPDWRLRVE